MSEMPRARHQPATHQPTYRQVFTGSVVLLAVVYVAFSFWVLFAPSTLPVGTVERQPILLVIVPACAMLLAALTAVAVTTIWWMGRRWWRPVRKPAASPRPSRTTNH